MICRGRNVRCIIARAPNCVAVHTYNESHELYGGVTNVGIYYINMSEYRGSFASRYPDTSEQNHDLKPALPLQY